MITKEKGYLLAVSKPNDKLVTKLKKLGWKPWQIVYFNGDNMDMRFFDNKDDLKKFLNKRNKSNRDDSSWDCMADIELQLDIYGDSIS